MVYSVNLAVIGFSIICLNKGFSGENLLLQSKTFLQGGKYIYVMLKNNRSPCKIKN